MRFMLQVRFRGAAAAIATLSAEDQRTVAAEFQAILRSPGVLDGNQLQPAGAAATVRVENGETRVTDGPAVDPDAALDGYYLCEAFDIETAIALAARIPVARLGGTIEVRPLHDR
ncbi:MAG TPA: YciI family protein [Solirubrobacteraceae bacterium]|nr:YciI family protein [Solirubrobacteraceae bacterium]